MRIVNYVAIYLPSDTNELTGYENAYLNPFLLKARQAATPIRSVYDPRCTVSYQINEANLQENDNPILFIDCVHPSLLKHLIAVFVISRDH